MPRKTLTGLAHTKSVKRHGREYVYFNTGQKIDGRVVYVSLGRKDADDFGSRYSAAKAARTRRTGLPTSLTVPQLTQRYDRSPEFLKKSMGTQRTYGVYLRRLATEFDNAPAGGLDSSDIYELMDDMAGKPAAIDMMILAGKAMYAWAVKRKYVLRNPFDEVDREDWEARAYQPWPDAVVEAALEDERLGLPVALLYFTAQRIGDVCRMRWDQIDGEDLHVVQQKTGKKILVPLHERLAAILASAPRTGETIMADARGKPLKDQTIRSWIARFGADHGVKLVPHGLRKNAVEALLEADCSVAETSAISGQSLQMVEHYAKQRETKLAGRRAIAKWERAGNRETAGKLVQETTEK